MKRWLILPAYCIPYAYLALRGDAVHGTMLLYLLMAVMFFLLCNAAVRLCRPSVILYGNLLSIVASCVCLALFDPHDMAAYFKPFTSWSLLLIVSTVAAIGQALFARWKIRQQQ